MHHVCPPDAPKHEDSFEASREELKEALTDVDDSLHIRLFLNDFNRLYIKRPNGYLHSDMSLHAEVM